MAVVIVLALHHRIKTFVVLEDTVGSLALPTNSTMLKMVVVYQPVIQDFFSQLKEISNIAISPAHHRNILIGIMFVKQIVILHSSKTFVVLEDIVYVLVLQMNFVTKMEVVS